MKAKYPEILWIAFGAKNLPYRAYTTVNGAMDFSKLKRYRLHPGNEVARALNVLHDNGHLCAAYTAKRRLQKAGFHVRWDAKKGRFV